MVIDASVAVKLLNKNEEHADIAFSLLIGEEEIIVPQLLFIEIANYLATKSHTTEESIKEGIAFIFDAKLTIYQLDENTLTEATILAKQYKTSVYDMLYAVTAKKHKCDLITADNKFRQKVGFPFVKLLKEVTT